MLSAASVSASQTVITEQNSTNFCDMLGGEPNLLTHIKTFEGFPRLKLRSYKLLIFWDSFQLNNTVWDAETIWLEFLPILRNTLVMITTPAE